jgi:hypothetical protein
MTNIQPPKVKNAFADLMEEFLLIPYTGGDQWHNFISWLKSHGNTYLKGFCENGGEPRY